MLSDLRGTPEARVPLLLVHHYKWITLSPEDFSIHLNECLLYTYDPLLYTYYVCSSGLGDLGNGQTARDVGT